MIFKLNTKIIKENENVKEINTIERLLDVKLIGKTGQKATIYDPELKMHFQNKSAYACLYEISSDNVQVDLTPRIQKASDYMRKIMYRFDWLKLKVSLKGKIVGIENKDELVLRWQKLRALILKDYEGLVLDNALKEIDQEFESDESLHSATSHYIHLGMLFTGIPLDHSNQWQKTRIIGFLGVEKEQFEEHITYENTIDNIRTYAVEYKALPNSEYRIEHFEGKIQVPVNELLPSEVNISIQYNENTIKSRWDFKLYKFD